MGSPGPEAPLGCRRSAPEQRKPQPSSSASPFGMSQCGDPKPTDPPPCLDAGPIFSAVVWTGGPVRDRVEGANFERARPLSDMDYETTMPAVDALALAMMNSLGQLSLIL